MNEQQRERKGMMSDNNRRSDGPREGHLAAPS
jgi:hypothetical protein